MVLFNRLYCPLEIYLHAGNTPHDLTETIAHDRYTDSQPLLEQ